MKILIITPMSPPGTPGGIATWTDLYLKSKVAINNSIDIVNTSLIGARVNNLTQKNFFVEFIRTYKILSSLIIKIFQNSYDIVHINTSCSTFGMLRDYICILLVKLTKSKIVLHIHCDSTFMVRGKFGIYIFKLICKLSNKIISLNKTTYRHIIDLINVESIIIPNGVQIDLDTKYRNRKFNNEIKNIIYVGHILKSKGCLEIFEVANRFPLINFLMIGKLSSNITSTNIPSNIKLYGEKTRDEVIRFMKYSDLLLFPSHSEGFPNVILEAMSVGLPIISTPVGAIPDILENNGCVYVEVGNVDSIETAIKYLSDIDNRKKVSEWNLKKVIEKYNFEEIFKNIIKVYTSI